MSAQDEDTDKSFDPTPHKLQEARKKGEVAKSVDLHTAAAYAGLSLAFVALGASSLQAFGSAMQVLLDQAGALSSDLFAGGPAATMGPVLWSASIAIAPIFLVPSLAVLAAILAQRAFVVAPTKLKPKLSKISLIQNAKQKFGRNGFFEFAKSFVKLVLYSTCLAFFLVARLPDMISVMHGSPGLVVSLLAELVVAFLFVVVIISVILGGVDAVWQHHEHIRKNRMSRKEIMDETKNSEGDPHFKQERRARAQAIATQQMMTDVPSADVIVVNPTHYAVALKWSRASGTAPVCVAKGVDEVALRIREIAQDHTIPIHSDPPTARTLYAVTAIGDEIEPDQYAAVAAAIRFADRMREQARGRI
ncbi:flagellar type III secretion system protein FlhB [Tateyamaria omphalii]|uniref:EscU/YscU/HrcU family type III secretion system export apparatus switch protein n=1 Tax=Tateyamaria omphalii TaxID=299262 RepID=UPI001C996093|nr:flagellar type III secretion system protein FlhB [Tateyamaria omphalii]MBY5933629.1 flagellar type III secretion system protein FlhB [Tateyamaria omphalii]